EGGDCFSFVQKVENMSFREALELLAQRANIDLPTRRESRSDADGTSRNRLYEVLAWAENEFHVALKTSTEGKVAREYLASRGFTSETIDRFRLGYHPQEWEFLQRRARGKFSPAVLLAARLIAERPNSPGYYDCFVDRVMFPIHDAGGRSVAFGGRVIPGREQPNSGKYLNSADSPVFSKNRLVYGLDVARPAIVAAGTAIVTEGYTDCILAHQHGVTNVVGTLGTALTENHVTVLKRFTQRVVLVYDGDEAGRKAAERSLPKFLAQDVDLRILTLPAPLDPADYLTQHGADAFLKMAHSAPEAWEYKLKLSAEQHGFNSIDARHRVMNEMLNLIAHAPRMAGSDRENLILGRLAHRVGVSEQVVRKSLKEVRRVASTKPGPIQRTTDGEGQKSAVFSGRNGRRSHDDLLEMQLLEILLASPQFVSEIRLEISAEEFRNANLRQLLQSCYDLAEAGIEPAFDRLLARFDEEPALKSLAVMIDEQARLKGIGALLRVDSGLNGPTRHPAFLTEAIEKLKWRRRQESHEQTKGQMAQHSGKSSSLDQETRELLKRAAEFHGERATKKSKI
ncbi:MAG: DNA primase, partial [Planctomycetaceae bacterium]